jgi:hypothetical protein
MVRNLKHISAQVTPVSMHDVPAGCIGIAGNQQPDAFVHQPNHDRSMVGITCRLRGGDLAVYRREDYPVDRAGVPLVTSQCGGTFDPEVA